MTKACLRVSTPFGVCVIREGHEVGDHEHTASVGCTARIAQWDLPHRNLFHIAAVGEQRYRIVASEVDALGFIVCEAELLAAEPAADAPDALFASVLASAVEQFGADRCP